MKILLTGKNGQVGWELQRTLSTLGSVQAVGRRELELTNVPAIHALVNGYRPDLIVHSAAYTAVDRAEAEGDITTRVNAKATAALADAAARVGAGMIGYSTDYVFDGRASKPYTEESTPSPLNAYGRSKLAGDLALAQSGAAYLLFRTSWVYGQRGSNFLLTMLRLGAKQDQVSVVAAQIGAPTSARSVAEATGQVIAILMKRAGRGNIGETIRELSGIYNMSCSGQTSWCGFAEKIFATFSSALGREVIAQPIKSSDYFSAAARPAYSLLSTEKLRSTFGIEMPSWEDAFRLVANDMLQASYDLKQLAVPLKVA